MNDELKRNWKEAVITETSQHLPEMDEEYSQKALQGSQCACRNSNQ
jgi:hypothetical protein